ncbi:MAG: patatin-like phospholipase family protein [Candidatus Aminicenantes bacterium]
MIGLSISGGGAKIGFAIGVLEVMEEKGIRPDIVYGISSGSLCTAALCYADVQYLKEQMLAVRKKSDVLVPRQFKAFLTQFFGGADDGLYGMSRMRQKLDEVPGDNPKINGVVGYVELISGAIVYVESHDKNVSKKDFLDAVQASCTIPFYMKTLRFGPRDIRVDGGVRDVLPLKFIFNKIKESNENSEIHIIGLSPLNISESEEPIKRRIVAVTKRSIEILVNEIYRNDFENAEKINWDIQHGIPRPGKQKVELYPYFPDKDFCDSLDFRKKTIEIGIEIGQKKAEEKLANYPSVKAPSS